mmetsp:Transcript_1132/g.2588  ORF Transcript_1132/g.2588 Transcript_1132/m.2588 type:complete len:1106 (+) Transcript_1132:95-3412(+)
MAAPLERTITLTARSASVSPQSLNTVKGGHPNVVRTTKFTLLTWLPISLYWQFQRVANIYFLFVAVIVCFPFSPKSWKSKVFPFAGVLLWTALKDLFEDYRRKRDDDKENGRSCLRLSALTHKFEQVSWKEVLVGDILFIPNDNAFPADLCLLQAAGGHESFISTVNLDGETNLKERRSPDIIKNMLWPPSATSVEEDRDPKASFTAARSSVSLGDAAMAAQIQEAQEVIDSMLSQSSLAVKMSAPEVGLADVRGTLEIGDKVASISETGFLPRGCVLRNTVWVIAMVVYAGDDTKTRLNAVVSRVKTSNLQRYLNMAVRGLLVCIFITNAICATAATVGFDDEDGWFIKFLIFCITLYHIVPISLYVCFEMLKLGLGFLLNRDKQMVDPETKKGAVARTADLMEELGQVNFLFSDKTGTLTANEMVFARCYIAEVGDLGDYRPSVPDRRGYIQARKLLGPDGGSKQESASLFFTCLAVCHAVQAELCQEHHSSKGCQPGDIIYSGMSPDEVALVRASHDVGIVFQRRERRKDSTSDLLLQCGGDSGSTKTFQVLHELEFNSDRKRMSVLTRQGDEVWCITKGADSVMHDLLASPLDHGATEAITRFSKLGLRTLVVGMKKVPDKELQAWEEEMRAAKNIVDSSRSAKVDELAARMEVGLSFVGVTAVEDRLQDGVPDCIQTIKSAGIRMWVLTGDKIETAVDIARSCALFGDATTLAYATTATSAEEAQKHLEQAKLVLKDRDDGGLVLDGATLKFALEDDALQALIYELGLACRSCICCRLTPLQKRRLVELVRSHSPSTITLAIGDGANDVPMIEGAHLGVGIRGKEGAQAVQVSDIAISQFRFLTPLLLCHGRRAYRRVAFFLCYYLYKNVALAAADIVWACQNSFSGRIAFPEYLSMAYNVLFTSWHIIFVLGFDEDVPDSVANRSPQLYLVGPRRALFNRYVFTEWMLYALWHGAVSWIVPTVWFGGDGWTEDEPNIFWVSSCTSFSLIVFIVNFRLLLLAESPSSFWCWGPSLLAMAMFFSWLFLLGHTGLGRDTQANFADVPGEMFREPKAVASFFVAIAIAMSVDVIEKFVRYLVFPTELQLVQKRLGKVAMENGD